MLTLTCCQDHILTENIWFVCLCSETSYIGDERRCYRCGTTKRRQTTEDRATQPMEAGGWVSQKVKVTDQVSEWVSESVTRSPIELFWTAKNAKVSWIWFVKNRSMSQRSDLEECSTIASKVMKEVVSERSTDQLTDRQYIQIYKTIDSDNRT